MFRTMPRQGSGGGAEALRARRTALVLPLLFLALFFLLLLPPAQAHAELLKAGDVTTEFHQYGDSLGNDVYYYQEYYLRLPVGMTFETEAFEVLADAAGAGNFAPIESYFTLLVDDFQVERTPFYQGVLYYYSDGIDVEQADDCIFRDFFHNPSDGTPDSYRYYNGTVSYRITGKEVGEYTLSPGARLNREWIAGTAKGGASFNIPRIHVTVFDPMFYHDMNYTHDQDVVLHRGAFVNDKSIGLRHDAYCGMYDIIDSFGGGNISGQPVWFVDWVGDSHGATLGTGYYVDGEWDFSSSCNYRKHLGVWVQNEPAEECTLQYEVICRWGGKQYSEITTLVYHQVDVADIGALNVPEPLVLEAGLLNELPLPIPDACADWFESTEARNELFIECEIPVEIEMDTEGNIALLTPAEAGIWPARLGRIISNIRQEKEVVLVVKDARGCVPMFWDSQITLNYLLMPEDTKGYNVDFPENWSDLGIDDPQRLGELLGGEPSFSTRHISGTQLELHPRLTVEDSIVFDIPNFLDLADGTKSVFDLTMDWGAASDTVRVTLNYTRPVLPDITFDTSLSGMRVGQTYDADVTLSDANWADHYFLYYDFWGNNGTRPDSFETFWDWEDPKCTRFSITPSEPGVYGARAHIHAGNLAIWGEMFGFVVADENGNLPDALPSFYQGQGGTYEVSLMLGELNTDGWSIFPLVDDFCPMNTNELRALYGNHPTVTWTVTHVSGFDPEAVVDVHGQDNERCRLFATSFPDAPTQSELKLSCDWNGRKTELPIKINFIAGVQKVPSGTTFPARVTVPVGDTVTLTGGFLPGDYDVEPVRALMEGNFGDIVEVEWGGPNSCTYQLTGLKEGVVEGRTRVGGYGGAYYVKPITITVNRDYLVLPHGLTTIESQAFAGVEDVIVAIPASANVTEIADDAFDPSVTVICSADSYAYNRCKELGLTVIGKTKR